MDTNMVENRVKRGLRPTPKDERDLKLGALYTLPKVADLPAYRLLKTYVKDQKDTDFCSAFMTTEMSETQEDVELDPLYSFAVSKELSEDKDEWGQDLRMAMQAHVKRGALPKSLSPYSLEESDAEFLRDIENWKSVQDVYRDVIRAHKKKSFFRVTGPYDHFDNIKASIQKFDTAVGSGVDWSWPLEQVYLDTIQEGMGHAITYVGWGDDFLWCKNHYGIRAGHNGMHKVPRWVVNHFVDIYGAFMFVDIPKEDARYHLEVGTSPEWPWYKQIYRAIINIFFKRT